MPQRDRHATRRGRLVRRFKTAKIDGLLVTDTRNMRYLTGFRGDDSALLVTEGETVLLTDSRYSEEAAGATRGVRIVVRKRSMMRTVARVARKAGVTRLGVETTAITLADADELDRWRRGMGVSRTGGLVEEFRAVKDADEIAAIRRAIGIAEQAFRLTVARVGPGRTEREAALLLDRTMQDLGADGPAFPTIVAAGTRTSLPHAAPTRRRIRRGEPVLFDFGARCRMYNSDLTRMIFWDRISPAFQRMFEHVLAAQRRALSRVRPGRRAGKIDAAARNYLKAHRHGKHFGHGLGHGIGLAVHEAPGIMPEQETVLRVGMVFSVEPGVYIPGRGGVRIEDLALVTRGGHSTLTSLPKTLASSLIN